MSLIPQILNSVYKCVDRVALSMREVVKCWEMRKMQTFFFSVMPSCAHALLNPLRESSDTLHSVHTVGRQLVQRGRRSLTAPHKAPVYWQGLSHLTQRLAGVYWKIKELISNYRRIFQSLPQLRDKFPRTETNPGALSEPASSARYGLLLSCRFI